MQVMNALEMEFEDDTFDLVWACESGEHMPDKKKYVEEMTRVLKPGMHPSHMCTLPMQSKISQTIFLWFPRSSCARTQLHFLLKLYCVMGQQTEMRLMCTQAVEW